MSEPSVVPPDALTGMTVAISVSESADLARMGLTAFHCRLAVAELARGILSAGGSLAYGGNLAPDGFTAVLVDEVRRNSGGMNRLDIYLAESVHSGIDADVLTQSDRDLGTFARIHCLNADGDGHGLRQHSEQRTGDDAQALTAMRRRILSQADALVAVGGKLAGFTGSMPGVIEEVALFLEASKPVYVAGGFGGAALGATQILNENEGNRWYPETVPADLDQHAELLRGLSRSSTENGLTKVQVSQLAVTHRPGDIASLVVLGLSKLRG